VRCLHPDRRSLIEPAYVRGLLAELAAEGDAGLVQVGSAAVDVGEDPLGGGVLGDLGRGWRAWVHDGYGGGPRWANRADCDVSITTWYAWLALVCLVSYCAGRERSSGVDEISARELSTMRR
jgi:hypothetical protein